MCATGQEINEYFKRMREDKTMNEQTITITVSEYKALVADNVILGKLERYTETHEYLSDDVIRFLLGTKKPAANLESEGD